MSALGRRRSCWLGVSRWPGLSPSGDSALPDGPARRVPNSHLLPQGTGSGRARRAFIIIKCEMFLKFSTPVEVAFAVQRVGAGTGGKPLVLGWFHHWPRSRHSQRESMAGSLAGLRELVQREGGYRYHRSGVCGLPWRSRFRRVPDPWFCYQ